MSNSSPLSTVYATDEDLAVRASGDFAVLCPDWQKVAYGTDGTLSGFALTSAVDFAALGVAAGHVVRLTKPMTSFRGGGELFGVASVATTTCTLKRLGRGVTGGQAPPAVSSVEFSVCTLAPQIEEASFAINRRFNIDPSLAGRTPADVWDLRDLRQATVLTVLCERYAAETRTDEGDFKLKLEMACKELTLILGRLQVRWGSDGTQQPPTNWFSTKLVR